MEGGYQKDFKISLGGGGRGAHQKVTEDHDKKNLAKLKVLTTEIITARISYQWLVQEVISRLTNIDLIRIALTKRNIFWRVV